MAKAATLNPVEYADLAGPQTLIDFEGIVGNNSAGTPNGNGSSSSFEIGSARFSSGTGVVILGRNFDIPGRPFPSATLTTVGTGLRIDFLTPVFSVSGLFGHTFNSATQARLQLRGFSGGLEQFEFTSQDIAPGRPGQFVGFVFDQPIRSLFYRTSRRMPTIDNLSYGTTPIPLPAAGWMLLSAFAGLIFVRRRSVR